MNVFLNFIFSNSGQPWKFFGGLVFLIVVELAIAIIYYTTMKFLPDIIHGKKNKKEEEDVNKK